MAYQLDPGPLDGSVLFGQSKHRSREIWDGHDNNVLNIRRCDTKFWKLVKEHPIDKRVLDVIIKAGLYGVYRSCRPAVDRSLITALVERWRPETHTFHFRNGEATITLQDVEVLYGLPIDGDAVLGHVPSKTDEEKQEMCLRLLGLTTKKEDFQYNTLKLPVLYKHLQKDLPEGATEEVINQKARGYIFWMIAGLLMADKTGGKLKLVYLTMLENVDTIRRYSWGSATLACLYRNLCLASQSTHTEISGFLPLLQVWTFERITVLRPKVVAQRNTENFFPEDLPRGPHAVAWYAHFSWTETTQYVLSVYRDLLDSMKEDQFIWQPYSAELIESLPEYCRAGRHLWRARVPIFCWDVVETHLPDRVMRQFGMAQHIPDTYEFDRTHFDHSTRGKPYANWYEEHAELLPLWNRREEFIFESPVEASQINDYLDWFRRITRGLIGNSGPRQPRQQGYVPNSALFEAMVRNIHSWVVKAESYRDQPTYEELIMFRDMVRDEGSSCLVYVKEADRLQVPANYRRNEMPAQNLHPQGRRRGFGGVTGRRAREIESGRVGGGAIRPKNRRAPVDDVPACDNNVPECEHGSTSGVSNEDFTRAGGSTDDVDGYDFGTASDRNTQNFSQVSNISCQSQNTQIVPYMTPQTPQYSIDPTFGSVFGHISNDFYDQAPPQFRSTPLPLSVEFPEVVDDEDGGDMADVNDGARNLFGEEQGGIDFDEGDITQVLGKGKRKKFRKRCGTGGHYIDQHGRKRGR